VTKGTNSVTLRLYNTLTRSKEDFVPREEGKVSMYVCGPTVYNHIHIGNARTFLSFDLIRRYLEHRGFDVRFVQNITDVDDKIIRAANAEGVPASEIAARYSDAFLKAMADLAIEPPTAQPRATETIPEMIEMVQRLIDRGYGYVVDGDVYFPVRSFAGYGKLSGRDIDELESGARVDVDERKHDPLDFALWKSAKPGEPHWSSPWGEGRPGWHLECSVMSEMQLGVPFDIHGGGSDLVFPHHENELAQSEAATGKPFARYWLHGGMLNINAEKMSMSLGNFTFLKDVIGAYPAPVLRLLMLQTHYRSPLDFSTERLDEATTAYERFANLVRTVRWLRDRPAAGAGAPTADRDALRASVAATRAGFDADMDDDFNSAGALGAIFELARAANGFLAANEAVLGADDLDALGAIEGTIVELLGVLGVTLPAEASGPALPAGLVPLARELAGYEGTDPAAAVDAILSTRATARSEKDWARADAVRDGLAALGVRVEDTASGARITVLGS
jgi:cysteinyl-tRNA synthetase